ncbi:MAG: DUF971 domain-containing protein [Chloroflexi bacterium]|nr:DUF971 domain-containing protein [Chloroflexota bacterium]
MREEEEIRIQPERITILKQSKAVEIRWADGHCGTYSYAYLRWHCPCAECRGEFGRPGRLDAVDHLAPEEEELSSLEFVGAYALQPVWASGHEIGIYTFETLRALCPCSECEVLRQRESKEA